MTTGEKLYILQGLLEPGDIQIEAVALETPWQSSEDSDLLPINITHYEIAIYLYSRVRKELKTKKEIKEFELDGAAAALDSEWVFTGEDLDEAVSRLFECFIEKGLII